MSEVAASASIELNVTQNLTDQLIEVIEVADLRDSSGAAVHHILVETRTKQLAFELPDQLLVEADISVQATYLYGPIRELQGRVVCSMGGRYRSYAQSVRLTNGSVMVVAGLRGLHIGTYLFHKVVTWSKDFDGNAGIVPITVVAADADPENRDRRNKLYTNSGIRLIWEVKGSAGRSDPALTVSDLTPYNHWPNIKCLRGLSALGHVWRDLDVARERIYSLKSSQRYYRRHYDRVEKRLQFLSKCLNWPTYLLFLALGWGSAHGTNWLQSLGW